MTIRLKMAALATRLGMGSTIARNSMMLVAAQVIGQAVSAGISILVARHLGKTRLGILTYAINFGVLASFIGELGVTRAAIQQMARDGKEKLARKLGDMVLLRVGANIVYAVSIWTALLIPKIGEKLVFEEKLLILIWSFSVIWQSLRRNSEAVFQATERMRYQAQLILINRLLASGAVGAIIWWSSKQPISVPNSRAWFFPLFLIIVAYFTVDLADATCAWIVTKRKLIKPNYTLDWAPKLELLKAGWPFGLQMLAGQIYYFIDTQLIKQLYHGTKDEIDDQIGLYAVAYKPVLVLILIPVNMAHALFPQMSRAYHENNLPRLYSLFSYGLNLCLLAGTTVAAAFFLFQEEFILITFKEKFAAAIPMLGIIIWTLPFTFVNVIITNLLAASDRQKLVNVSYIAGAVFNIGLNCLLIPRLGGIGSSIATVTTEVLCVALILAFVLRHHSGALKYRFTLLLLAFQVVSVCAFFAIQHQSWMLRLAVLLAYGAACGFWARELIRRRRAE